MGLCFLGLIQTSDLQFVAGLGLPHAGPHEGQGRPLLLPQQTLSQVCHLLRHWLEQDPEAALFLKPHLQAESMTF